MRRHHELLSNAVNTTSDATRFARRSSGLSGVSNSVSEISAVVTRLGEAFIHAGDAVVSTGASADAEYHEALRCFLVARCFQPASAYALMKVGVGFDDCRMFNEACENFKRALSICPPEEKNTQAEATFHYGESLSHLGKLDDALVAFTTASTLAASSGNATLVTETTREKAVVLTTLSRHSEAAKCYGICAELNPTVPELHCSWAMSLKHAKLYNKAVKRYRVAEALYERRGDGAFAESVGLEIDECRALKAGVPKSPKAASPRRSPKAGVGRGVREEKSLEDLVGPLLDGGGGSDLEEDDDEEEEE